MANDIELNDISIRFAQDDDSSGIIRLIEDVFSEYDDIIFDVDLDMPDLRRPASSFSKKHGKFWIAEHDDEIVASVAIGVNVLERTSELFRLYVAKGARNLGLGSVLCDLVESYAREQGAKEIELWSDVKFEDAHHLYLQRGYFYTGQMRDLNDLAGTTEYFFRKDFEKPK